MVLNLTGVTETGRQFGVALVPASTLWKHWHLRIKEGTEQMLLSVYGRCCPAICLPARALSSPVVALMLHTIGENRSMPHSSNSHRLKHTAESVVTWKRTSNCPEAQQPSTYSTYGYELTSAFKVDTVTQ